MRTRIGPRSSASRASAAAATASARSRERDEEGVALGVDLDAVVPANASRSCGARRGDRRTRPVLLEEPRRALDVGEEEGDGARSAEDSRSRCETTLDRVIFRRSGRFDELVEHSSTSSRKTKPSCSRRRGRQTNPDERRARRGGGALRRLPARRRRDRRPAPGLPRDVRGHARRRRGRRIPRRLQPFSLEALPGLYDVVVIRTSPSVMCGGADCTSDA